MKHPKTRLVIETPQQFFLRIACALSETVPEALELYGMICTSTKTGEPTFDFEKLAATTRAAVRHQAPSLPFSFHANLFKLVESSGALVRVLDRATHQAGRSPQHAHA